MSRIKVFAPATVANVAVGFDLMGFAIEGVGDIIEFEKTKNKQVVEIVEINTGFPRDPNQNTASIGVIQMLKDRKVDFGINLRIHKGIPVGSGLGGSAASAVGGVFGANALFTKKFKTDELFQYALLGEKVASGSSHPDNIAPCLLGGFVYTHSIDPFEYYKLNLPSEFYFSLLHPKVKVETKHARAILKPNLLLSDFIEQNKNLSGFLIGIQNKNEKLIAQSLKDFIVEPQRAHLIPNFEKMKKAAFQNKALAFSISGSGPTVFALSKGFHTAKKVLNALKDSYKSEDCNGWITPVSKKGVRFL